MENFEIQEVFDVESPTTEMSPIRENDMFGHVSQIESSCESHCKGFESSALSHKSYTFGSVSSDHSESTLIDISSLHVKYSIKNRYVKTKTANNSQGENCGSEPDKSVCDDSEDNSIARTSSAVAGSKVASTQKRELFSRPGIKPLLFFRSLDHSTDSAKEGADIEPSSDAVGTSDNLIWWNDAVSGNNIDPVKHNLYGERLDSGCACESLESSTDCSVNHSRTVSSCTSSMSPKTPVYDSALACQLSPHLVVPESPKRQQVRNVGRLARLDAMSESAIPPEGVLNPITEGGPMSVRVLRPEINAQEQGNKGHKYTCSDSACSSESDKSQGSIKDVPGIGRSVSYRSQESDYSQTSDTTIAGEPVFIGDAATHSSSSTDKDTSSVVIRKKCMQSPCVTSHAENFSSSEVVAAEFIHDSGVFVDSATKSDAEKSENVTTSITSDVKISYSRNNSFMDEYLNDDSIEVLPTKTTEKERDTECTDIPPRSDAYKRLASIEGSSSIFNAYIEELLPDCDQLRKLALENCGKKSLLEYPIGGRLPHACYSSEESTSMFDEYFHDDNQSHNLQSEVPKMSQRPDTLMFRHRTGSGASLLRRQNSSGRRSLTPTELGRRSRHISCASVESVDPFVDLNEVPIPKG